MVVMSYLLHKYIYIHIYFFSGVEPTESQRLKLDNTPFLNSLFRMSIAM